MSAPAQLEFADRLGKVVEDDPRVPQLETWLRGRNWVTAGDIHGALGWSDRLVRALAEASNGRIIGGQKGYRLTREANPDEINAAADWLQSQAHKMLDRARKIRLVLHAHHLPSTENRQITSHAN